MVGKHLIVGNCNFGREELTLTSSGIRVDTLKGIRY